MKKLPLNVNAIKWTIYSLLIFFTFIFQTTFGASIRIFSVIPNLLFALVLCISVFEGAWGAVWAALGAGVLIDFCSSYYIGFNMLFLTIICAATGYLAKEFLKGNLVATLLASFLAAAAFNALFFFFHVMLFNSPGASGGWLTVLIEAVLTAICALGWYFIIGPVHQWAFNQTEEFE